MVEELRIDDAVYQIGTGNREDGKRVFMLRKFPPNTHLEKPEKFEGNGFKLTAEGRLALLDNEDKIVVAVLNWMF